MLGALDPIIRRFGIVSKDDLWLRKLAHFTEFAALGAELLFLAAVRRLATEECSAEYRVEVGDAVSSGDYCSPLVESDDYSVLGELIGEVGVEDHGSLVALQVDRSHSVH